MFLVSDDVLAASRGKELEENRGWYKVSGHEELPFVISSSIYENPVRIVVTVNTTDEASISKVKTFDTVGGMIEVIYKENGVMDKNGCG